MNSSFHNDPILFVHSFSTGFIDVPSQISLNVFVFGCRKRCSNCQNPELQEFSVSNPVTPSFFKEIIEGFPLSSWICFLGGDAVYQPRGLEALAKEAKNCGKNVCLYTGMSYEELDFLDKTNLDLIIDGEYMENLGGVHQKTTNQRIFLRFKEKGVLSVNFNDLPTYLTDKSFF